MRWIVCTVSGVCSVASTRWPVSAAISAVSMVSRSRISPITITSGSCRKTWTNASRKVANVGAHLLLNDDAAKIVVDELHGVLDRHDLGAAIVVDQVDHEVQRRRLADARRAGQQDQAVGQAAQFFDHGRKPQFGGRADGLLAQAEWPVRDSRHESRRWRESGPPLPRAARSKAATAPGGSRAAWAAASCRSARRARLHPAASPG